MNPRKPRCVRSFTIRTRSCARTEIGETPASHAQHSRWSENTSSISLRIHRNVHLLFMLPRNISTVAARSGAPMCSRGTDMSADTCSNGRRGDFSTTTHTRDGGALSVPVSDFQATCPDCGRAMTRDTRNVRHLSCTFCGKQQHIDVLGPTATARQADALHDRGLDRLLNAIGG